jgi:hypothetical protein
MLIFAVWICLVVSKCVNDFRKTTPFDYPTTLVFWQANRFALDDRSLSESLGSTGPGQYEADSDGIQMGFRWV